MAPREKSNQRQQQMILIGGIVAIALIIFAAILILANPSTASSGIDYSRIHAERLDDGGFILGNPEAPVTVVAFEDFLCSHCRDYQPTVKEFIREYVATGQARFEFRMLPISQQSGLLFSLAECTAIVQDDPSTFWHAHDVMFNLSGTRFEGKDFADEMDMSYGALLNCANDADQYNTDAVLSQNQSQEITGTPTIVWRLNGGQIRFDVINRRPTIEELASLVAFANSIGQR